MDYKQLLNEDFDAELENRINMRTLQLAAKNEELNEKIVELEQVRQQQGVWSEAQMWVNEAQQLLSTEGDVQCFYEKVVYHAMLLTRAKYGAYISFDGTGKLIESVEQGTENNSPRNIENLISDISKLLSKGEHVQAGEHNEKPTAAPSPPPPVSLLSIRVANEELAMFPLYQKGALKKYFLLGNKKDDELFDIHDEMALRFFVSQVDGALERQNLIDALKCGHEELKHKHEEQCVLVNKLQEAQGQILQSEKMASIGQLAAGVAHEINNPIAFVFSNMNAMQKYVGDLLKVIEVYEQADPFLEQNKEIFSNIQLVRGQAELEYLKEDISVLVNESRDGLVRVKQIVQDLKDFSHVDEAEWQWVDLHQCLNSTLNIVNNEIKYKAEVMKEFGDLPKVECMASQLNQVFMNLLINASHAIEKRGSIIIRTRLEDEWVCIEIIDTGRGIEPAHMNRLFEPFFTTKPVGIGTGLGLSLSYGIVNKHGGHIDVERKPGKGSRFRILLPVRQAEEGAKRVG